MSNINDNNLDDLLRRAAEKYPLRTDSADFGKLVADLEKDPSLILPPVDKEDRRRRRRFFWLFLLLPLAGGAYFAWHGTTRRAHNTEVAQDKQAMVPGATTETPKVTTVEQAGTSGTTTGENTPGGKSTGTGQTTKGTVAGDQRKIVNGEKKDKPGTGTETIGVGGKGNEEKNKNNKVGNGMESVVRQGKGDKGAGKGKSVVGNGGENVVVGGNGANGIAGTNERRATGNKAKAAGNKGQVVGNNAEVARTERKAAGNDEEIGGNEGKATGNEGQMAGNEKRIVGGKISLAATKGSVNVNIPVKAGTTATATATKGEPQKNKVKLQKPKPSFYVGLVGSPDLSTVRFQSVKHVGYSFGLLLGYSFNSRWAIETGLYYDKKKYYTDGEYFSKAKVPTGNYTIKTVDGYCNMWEIPLNVRYNFSRGDKMNWFATAGFSNYLMSKEVYTFAGNNNWGQPWERTWPYKTPYKYWFSIFSLSVGYEQRLGKIGNLRLEPFVRVPLSGIGTGSLNIMSAGLNIGITRRIW